ncbi:hypothetical protein BDW74DRAFT_152948 [Aspergillus multicolor]|uniref:dienelactone hydrolase family protein n=1 Tax=Aspergillus multicolor TaxID=41759 RepID=UPI003CCD4338
MSQPIHPCCITGFTWSGTPTGHESTLAQNKTYITGTNKEVAILFVADLFGWTFPNVRLLADHFAREIDATVFVPDYFGGEVIDFDLIATEQFDKIDVKGFAARNGREQREPEIFETARALKKELGFKKVGAVGYCYGGWASFRLAAKEHAENGEALVDVISIGHPSWLTKRDIDEIDAGIPVQILAPEIDPAYSAEMKSYTFETLQRNGVVFDYQHFPGVVHACFIRGDEKKPGEREAMVRGKNAAVQWFRGYLKDA